MRLMHHIQALTIASVLGARPDIALACAVCGSQEEKAAGAYLGMTIVLSLLPISLIGGAAYWLWRRAKSIPPCEPPKPQPSWKDLMLSHDGAKDVVSMQNPDTSLGS